LRLRDDRQLSRSQSGGAFFAIAELFIKEGGVVYGAAFNEYWTVSHKRVSNNVDLESLRMTKYVQSDMRGIYAAVKSDLKSEHQVLFSGTACQVAGLKSYIPISLHKNLLCIDIICHGVPSPQIWKDYLVYLERKFKSPIVKACFRDKQFGWHGAIESFIFSNGREEHRRSCNYLYFSGLSIRESCANCKFTNTKRVGDITIGDHWGLRRDDPYEKDGKGVSLLLINSKKGNDWFQKITNKIICRKVQLENNLQPQLKYPSELHPKHTDFVRDYQRKGFLYVAKRYGDLGWRYKARKQIESIIRKIR
jgi:coenzyme F420-reducing hydrogenase beta subunit